MAKRYTNEHDGAGGFPLSLLAVACTCTVSSCKQYIIEICLTETHGYKINRNVVYKCYYHVVWCPKYWQSVLHSGVEERLKQVVHDVCDELGAELPLPLSRSTSRIRRQFKKKENVALPPNA